jgi:phosphopentomutase
MGRALLIVLDSVGIGGAPDAQAYGDLGADTLGHIAQACALGRGNREGLRAGPLHLPHLARLGLGLACSQATGAVPPGLDPQGEATALWGSAIETSRGKDTPSGHWELMGCPVDFDWGYFPQTVPTFPPDLIAALCDEGGLPGILGNRHASGTTIIAELGAEHMRSGRPIVYTSTDSVLQIAAHEEAFGLQRLLDLCRLARRLCDPLRIGRVIARPFLGTPETGFSRTGNRRDYAVPPPRPTLFDSLAEAGREVVSVGKIADIFAHRATGREVKAHGNMAVVDACLAALDSLDDGGFVFGNCVDFDSEFGHRRDVPGYAAALEAFDARVPDLHAALRPGDMLVLTADHGNDPTWPGTDHTREQVPVLAVGPGISFGSIGTRSSLADVGASVAAHLGIVWRGPGTSFLAQGLR